MKKGILIASLAVFLGIAGYVIKEFLFPNNLVTSKSIDAVPADAAIIIRSEQLFDFWNKELTQHPSWKVNKFIPSFQNINHKIQSLDSIAKLSSDLKDLLYNHEIYLSTLMTGPKSYDVLLSTELGAEGISQFESFKNKYLSTYNIVEHQYNETTIYDILLEDNKRISFSICNGVLLVSETPNIVEKAILQLHSNVVLSEDPIISKLWNTAIKKSNANIFINFEKFGEVTGTFLNNNNKLFLEHSPIMGNWCELDLSLKDHGVYFTGLIATSDSLSHYFYNLRNQQAGTITADKILPSNTGYFTNNIISDQKQYVKDYSIVLDKHKLLFEYENNIQKIKDKYGVNQVESFQKTIGSEWVTFITEPISDTYENNICFAYKLSDIENDINLIDEFFLKISKDSVFTEIFQNYKVKEIHDANILNALFNKTPRLSNHIYYTYIEDFIVFANEVGNMKHVINSYSKGNTLKKNTSYQEFANNFPSKSNLFAYYNFRYGSEILNKSLNKDCQPIFNSYSDSIKEWEAAGLMISGGEDLLYSNAYIKYNPLIEDNTMSLYSKTLKAPIASKPIIVKNHYNNSDEILVQDENNILYLLTSDGKQLFSLDLGEKIISDIHQVDRYKNNKLQYLFNTKSSLYLIDRNGEFVEDFPITLSTKATNGLNVFDYDNNRNYRIFLANEKNEVLCFDIRGKQVNGWEKFKSKAPIKEKINHLSIDNKDYLVTCDYSGHIIILNRRGNERIKINEYLPSNRNYFLNITEDINTCSYVCTDTIGSVYSLSFADIKNITPIKAFTEHHSFHLADINNDGYNDFIFVDEGTVSAFKLTKSPIFEYENSEINHFSDVSILQNTTSYIGITDESSGLTYLLDSNGNLLDGFPIEGDSPMTIKDINNDGKQELIIGDSEGNVYFYSFGK